MERCATVKRLHQAALEACGEDKGLRRKVEFLLAYEPSAESFMESPALEVTDDVCAHQCAQTRSKNHHSAANANQIANKNGLKSHDFRPVL